MTGSLTALAIAGLVVLATHFGMSWGPARSRLVGLAGEAPFRGVYSLVSLAAFVWLGLAYAAAPPGAVLWSLGMVGAGLAYALALIALVFIVAGVSTPNPTLSGQMIGGAEPVRVAGVLRVTRHPLMWGIGLWGLGHLAANGETRAVLLMGTVTALALLGTVTLDRKYAAREPQRYGAFKAATSNLPFLAAIAGRQPLAPLLREIGVARLAVAVVLYLVMIFAHPWLAGVPLGL